MFEYTKDVLQKVSFDVSLFCKEVEKATKVLLPYEIDELRDFILDLVRVNPALEVSLAYVNP